VEFFSLKNKAAVITGGGSGIGLATAKRFVAAGANVVIANRSDSHALARSFGAHYMRADVSEESDVEALLAWAASQFGAVNVMVNNAGFGEVGVEAQHLTRESLDKHLRINLHGVLYGIKHSVRYMPPGSSIVNVASLAGCMGLPGYSAYVASKWAVLGLTRSAAIELGPRGIRVNCLCPGTIDTPINQQAGADAELVLVKALTPVGRIGQPEEMAGVIHFLASDDSSYVTGTEFIADGGWNAGLSIGTIEKIMVGVQAIVA
jgi:NAD(P)-dependent dehydrogenase (short-subunit alcohol dehydrogenase family)